MKLAVPPTLLALALIQAPDASLAFAPLSTPPHCPHKHHHRHHHHHDPLARRQHRRQSSSLRMVGFKDPREKENAEAMKAVSRLNYETKKVKKWLAELMQDNEADSDTPPAPSGGSPADDIGLLGGGGGYSAISAAAAPAAAAEYTASYKPSLRADLGNTVLLTGTYHPTLLRVLNNNDFGSRESAGGGGSGDLVPNFEFRKIILAVQGGEEAAKEVKKRVISRENRYSGLLDKLVIEAEETLLPSPERMEGVTSWIVRLDKGQASEMLPQVAELASGCAALKNVLVMVEGVDSMAGTVDGWESLLHAGKDKFQSTLLAVGELYDAGTEGKFYHIGNFVGGEVSSLASSSVEMTNADANAPTMFRDDAYLTLANLLALECSSNKALGAYEFSATSMEKVLSPIDETPKKVLKDGEFVPEDVPEEDEWKAVKYANRIVRGMRELGFSRLAELDVLLDKGVNGYIEYMNAPPKPLARYEKKKDKWDEIDEKIMAQLDAELAVSEAKRKAEEEQQYKEEVEGMARDWAIREYALRSLRDEVDGMTEREFIQSVWEEALEEGEKLYATINSESYKRKLEKKDISEDNHEFFYEGMDPKERRKRELIMEKVKRQYLEMFGEDDELEVEEEDELEV
ncbi:hypothetical protein HJC23_009000 [Cyclotella cryptica]|uniref:Uncharacterized protein n=1 Tax=Cyclotella cryptica TaxID=29204 RepID=A0ABD3QXT6_9STRA|eukprot:CCRYP_000595-RA/>CCRYP_000595-RA protein AED:0.03 eAED:0.03 QI:353/1/1/1/1/1/2/56/629